MVADEYETPESGNTNKKRTEIKRKEPAFPNMEVKVLVSRRDSKRAILQGIIMAAQAAKEWQSFVVDGIAVKHYNGF